MSADQLPTQSTPEAAGTESLAAQFVKFAPCVQFAPCAPCAPFVPLRHVQTPADVRALALTPLDQAIQPRSTCELIRNAALAFGDKTALTFLPTAEPDPRPDAPSICWSYAQLLARVHQTANALFKLGLHHDEAVAVLLPACLEYHLALWGGAAAGIVQPLNPLLSDDKLVSLMNAAQARVLIARAT